MNRAELELYLALGRARAGRRATRRWRRRARPREPVSSPGPRDRDREGRAGRAHGQTTRRRTWGGPGRRPQSELARRLEAGALGGRPGCVAARGTGRGRRQPERRGRAVGRGSPVPAPPLGAGPRHRLAGRGTRARTRRDDVRGVWHACRRGLDALDDHRATLGSTELRARASVRGDELARLALTHAVARATADLAVVERTVAGHCTRPARAAAAARPGGGESLRGVARQRAAPVRGPRRRRVDAASLSGNEPGSRRPSSTGGASSGPRTAPGRSGRPRRGPAGRGGRRRDVRGAGRGRRRLRSVVVTGGRVRAYAVGSAADATAAVDAAGSCCGRRRAGGRSGLPTSGPASRQALLGPSVAAFGRDRSWSRRPPRCTRLRGACCPPGRRTRDRRADGLGLAARPGSRARRPAGCSSPVRGWPRGERRSRWWRPSTRRPWS